MSQYFEMHPGSPSPKDVALIVDSLQDGAVIAYPTDSGYALGCAIGLPRPLKRISKIRDLDDKHNFTLICQDLSEISRYAQVSNSEYRLLKKLTPGGYTFILPATHEVPKLILAAHRKTIGIRVPDCQIALDISKALGQPLLSTTLILPGQSAPLVYAEDVIEAVGNMVDVVIDGGYCGFDPTTVVDCTVMPYEILREGSGDISYFSKALT